MKWMEKACNEVGSLDPRWQRPIRMLSVRPSDNDQPNSPCLISPSRYFRPNNAARTAKTSGQITLASGPTVPPVSQLPHYLVRMYSLRIAVEAIHLLGCGNRDATFPRAGTYLSLSLTPARGNFRLVCSANLHARSGLPV